MYLDERRVTGESNYTAAGDWVVAIFPRLFELLNERLGVRTWGCDELGTAGFNGFESAEVHDAEVRYLKGNHGAAVSSPAVRKTIYSAMADFLRTGKAPDKLEEVKVGERVPRIVLFSNLCWLIWLGIAGLLFLIGVLLAQLPGTGLQKLLYVALYVAFLLSLLLLCEPATTVSPALDYRKPIVIPLS